MGVYLGRNKVDMLGGTPIALNGTNTSDATVTENDLAKDVIAYGANGRIVGKTPTIKNGVFSKASNCSVHSNAKEYVSVDLMCDSDTLLRSGSGLFYNIDSSRFGNAKKEDVLSGVTFTSSSGLLEEGTLVVKEEEIGNYEYTSNGSKTITPSDGKVFSKVNVNINVPSSGIDTSDANVEPSDLAAGVVAYGKDGQVIGTLPESNGLSNSNPSLTYHSTVNQISVEHQLTKDTIVRLGSIRHWINSEEFGTASASDVAQGVTFTSESGLKVEGELEVHDVVGSVGIASNYDTYKAGNDLYVDVFTDVDVLIRSGSGLGATIPLSEFGTATEDKVLEGVTYTGADGHKKQGKMKASSGVTLPEGAVVVQMVTGAETSTQVGSGYSLSVAYGSTVEINDSLALAFVGSTSTLSNISATTDFSVLQGKYIRTGSGTTQKYYYISDGSTFTVGGQSYNKTLTCDRAQQVTIQKVSL